MPYKFRDARIQSGKSQKEVAEQLGISNVTVNNWESGRRLPTIEALEELADLYQVSADYLLGRDKGNKEYRSISEHVENISLQFLHDCPVYVQNVRRWGVVNAPDQKVTFSDGSSLPFSDIQKVYTLPEPFLMGWCPIGKPLDYLEIEEQSEVWVEPVSRDEVLRQELRGWYIVKNRYVENELGQRFYLDTYGNKWWAFLMEKRI